MRRLECSLIRSHFLRNLLVSISEFCHIWKTVWNSESFHLSYGYHFHWPCKLPVSPFHPGKFSCLTTGNNSCQKRPEAARPTANRCLRASWQGIFKLFPEISLVRFLDCLLSLSRCSKEKKLKTIEPRSNYNNDEFSRSSDWVKSTFSAEAVS